MKRTIRLRSLGGPTANRAWESDSLLRAGRLASLEIVLDDTSVSRRHAELRALPDGGWVVKDLNSTNGTFVNGTRLAPWVDQALKSGHVVQFGKIPLEIELLDATAEGPNSDQMYLAAAARPVSDPNLSLSHYSVSREWLPQITEQLQLFMHAAQHAADLQSEESLLNAILNECVTRLDAQRGAILLSEPAGKPGETRLRLRAMSVGSREARGRFYYSKRLAGQCFANGESRLFRDGRDEKELMSASISDGAMSSVMCLYLRTPRRQLGVLHLDRGPLQGAFTESELTYADMYAAYVSPLIECAQVIKAQKELFHETVRVLAEVVESRDDYTYNHTKRVTFYATALAEALKAGADDSDEIDLDVIKIGTPLHDIGKIAIRDDILRAERRLTDAEFAEMKRHTTIGAEYLADYGEKKDKMQVWAGLKAIIPIVRHHHERWDGAGYPDQLGGGDIPLAARIVAVADAFDAMTTKRPYHEAGRNLSPEWAFEELEKQSGRQFDPRCVETFLEIRPEILRIYYQWLPRETPATPPTPGPKAGPSDAPPTREMSAPPPGPRGAG